MRVLLTAACAVAVFSVSDAYTASNGVPRAAAGAGSGAISGYAVSDLRYDLDGAAVSSLSFSLDPPEARTVRVRLAPGGPWHSCRLEAGSADCSLGAVDPATLEQLEVVAAG
jgi:hypothetical protein